MQTGYARIRLVLFVLYCTLREVLCTREHAVKQKGVLVVDSLYRWNRKVGNHSRTVEIVRYVDW